MRTSRTYDSPRKQSGSTLIVTLIILILVMLLGVTAMTTSDMQFKLTGNLQFEDMALNNAEMAASTAELGLASNALASSYPQTAAPQMPVAPAPLFDPLAMSWTNADPIPSQQVIAGDDTQRFVIVFVSTNPSPFAGIGLDCTDPGNAHNFDCVNTFLVTTRGTSARGATKYIQTYYAVPLK